MSNQETRTKLLDTALELIWQSNYNSVGVNEICKQAGVTKGSFYHYFESKASLFVEATDHYWAEIKLQLDEITSSVHPPLMQLRLYMRFIYSRKFDDKTGRVLGSPYFTCGAQTGCEEKIITESMSAMCSNGIFYNRIILDGLKNEGCLEDQIDTTRSARMLSQYIQGVVAFARIDGDLQAVKKDFIEAFFRLLGLKKEYWFNPFD